MDNDRESKKKPNRVPAYCAAGLFAVVPPTMLKVGDFRNSEDPTPWNPWTGLLPQSSRLVVSADAVTLPSGQCVNLDNGVVSCDMHADISLPLRAGLLSPKHSLVALGSMSVDEFDSLNGLELLSEDYSDSTINLPEVGEVLAVRTNEDNLAIVQVIERQGFDLIIRFKSFGFSKN